MADRPDVLRERADPSPEAIARSLDGFPGEAGTVGETLVALDAERRPAAVAAVAGRLSADDVTVRRAAALALSVCFETHPETESDTVAELAGALEDDDHVVRKHAGTALQSIARQEPEDAVVAVESLPELLDAGSPDHLSAGLDIAAGVAEADPDAAVPLVDPLLETLADLADRDARPSETSAAGSAPTPAVREYEQQYATELDRQRARAVAVVERVLTARPEALATVDTPLSALLRRETLGAARATLAETLGRVAESEPEAVASTIDDLAVLLDDDPVVAASAAWALGMIADPHGRRVADAVEADVDSLAALLAVDPPGARIASATLLAYVAEHRPDAVDPAADSLVAALDDEHPDVRASAALALGHAGRTDALADLRNVADGDPDEQVRSTAALAVERIESDS